MIRVNKGEEPDLLKSDEVHLAIERTKQFYSLTTRAQKRYSFPFLREIDKQLKNDLHELFHGKCGYCEIKIESPEYGTIDRFRPHNGVRDKNDYFKDLYWWLTYDWDNLVYSCKDCNQYKGNYFPILGNRATESSKSLDDENKLLVNPCTDDPEKFIDFDNGGNIYSNSEEGNITIKLLKLNREKLLSLRKKAIDELWMILDELLLKGTISSENERYLYDIYTNNTSIEFLSVKKHVLLDQISNNTSLIEILDFVNFNYAKSGEKIKLITNQIYESTKFDDFFPIESIRIINFKAISDLTINFKEDELDHKSWLFLLGENGVGKSSILQAIAIGLKPILKTGDPTISELIKYGEEKAEIKIKIRNTNEYILTSLHKTNRINHSGDFYTYLLGYGSYRLPFHKDLKIEKKTKVRYMNLLDYSYSLNNSYEWLLNLFNRDKGKFNIVATALLELLPASNSDRVIIKKKGKLVFSDKQDIDITNYSEGFKSVLSLALDIMMTLSADKVDIELLSGIVIIDELGNQLHPQWQMKIVTKLRDVFPKIQFIVSSHNPLCLRGINQGEVLLLKEKDNEVYVVDNLPDPNDFSIEQILKSDFFGLNSTYMIENQEYYKYYNLILRKKKKEILTESEEDEYNALRSVFQTKEKYLGNSLREELIYDAVDQLIAQQYLTNSKLSRMELSDKTIELFKTLWENRQSDDKN